MLRPSGPTGHTFAEWYRPSGRADERPQCRTHAGRATRRASAHVPSETPSGAQNLDRRGLDFDGNELEIRSSSRTTACWRSWYAATLYPRWSLLRYLSWLFLWVSLVLVPMMFGASLVFFFLAVFGFLPGGGTTRRSDAVTEQYLNDILDLFVVVGFLATKRYDETRPLSVSCTRARVTFPHAQDRVSCAQRYLGLL